MTSGTVSISNPSNVHKPMGYSHLAQVSGGRVLYIAGQVAQDANGTLIGKDDFGAQVRQVFLNLKAVIESAGGTCADLVKLNYYCCDRVSVSDTPIVREVRDQYVNTQAPPVSTFVFVSRLVRPEWLIEIEAVAVLASESRT